MSENPFSRKNRSLPPELIDHVMQFLSVPEDSVTLRCCSLVAKSWTPTARRWLFKSRTFSRGNFSDYDQSLVPKFGTYVEQLTLEWYERAGWSIKYLTAHNLPNLKVLRLNCCRISQERTLVTGIRCISTLLPQIEELFLEECAIEAVSVVQLYLLSYLRNIRHIGCHHLDSSVDSSVLNESSESVIGIPSIAPFIPPLATKKPKPITLSVCSSPELINTVFWHACASIPGFEVTRINVTGLSYADLSSSHLNSSSHSFNSLVQLCSSTLTELHVSTDTTSYMDFFDLSGCRNLTKLTFCIGVANGPELNSSLNEWAVDRISTIPLDNNVEIILAIYSYGCLFLPDCQFPENLEQLIRSRSRSFKLQVFHDAVSDLALDQPDRDWRQHYLREFWDPLLKIGRVAYVDRSTETELCKHDFMKDF